MTASNYFWGLHLNNDAVYEKEGESQYGTVTAIRGKSLRLKYSDLNDGSWYPAVDCRPVCRHLLSDMTKGEVSELVSMIRKRQSDNTLTLTNLGVNAGFVMFYMESTSSLTGGCLDHALYASVKELNWLQQRGFNCGQFPDGSFMMKGELNDKGN
ncbi:MAG: hypothetical protein WC279_14310 [Sulfurimonas sp.]|jgi:hypothetical protein|uniref:hypothetical protein n=1 Tax=Sulfurimonas sp. TaxID=2022749 RepID=UPI003568B842